MDLLEEIHQISWFPSGISHAPERQKRQSPIVDAREVGGMDE